MSMKYIGKGEFVPPYPARDLSDDEVKEFGKDALLATGLYAEEGSGKPAAAPKTSKKEGEE